MSNTNDKNSMLFDVFKEAISIEIYGREYYSIFSDAIDDENAKALFRGLARDEGEHREWLEKEYKKLKGKPIDIKMLDEKSREGARHIFPEPLVPMDMAETKDALKLGIRTEERSIELYSSSAEKTDIKSTRDLFLKLVHFEEGHKEKLEDALYYLEQEGTWYGYSPPTIEG